MSPEVKKDMVNHPEHYISKQGIETIEVIEAFTENLKGIEAVDTANVIKYICRWKNKNGLEDLKKARWYLNHLISMVEDMDEDKVDVFIVEEDSEEHTLDGESYLLYPIADSCLSIHGDKGIKVINTKRESIDDPIELYLRKG